MRIFTNIIAGTLITMLFAPLGSVLFFSRAEAQGGLQSIPGIMQGMQRDPTFSFPAVRPGVGVGTSVPVFDLGVQQNTAAIAGATKTDAYQSLYEWFARFLRETLRKQLLDMIVSQIINWIQGGGEPKFVTDWQGFLEDAGNIAVGKFAEEIGLGFLCEPFALPLKLAFGIGGAQRGFSQQITSTLDDIVGNIENFYNDFGNGGWAAYQRMLQPQNNFYGAYLMGFERFINLQGQSVAAAQLEAQVGGGFLSTKQCQEAYGPWPQGGAPPDLDRDGTPGDIARTCKITTPGSTIGALASKAVGSDIDYILRADELEEYVSAIADALINRLILEGAQGLAGLTNANAPAGGSIPAGTSGCAGLTGSAQASCINYLNPPFQANAPTRPTGLNANSVATSTPTIRLTWDDNSINEDGYRVERSAGNQNSFISVAFMLPANTNSYIDTGTLTAGTTYYYRVRAFNSAGVSQYSNIANETAQ